MGFNCNLIHIRLNPLFYWIDVVPTILRSAWLTFLSEFVTIHYHLRLFFIVPLLLSYHYRFPNPNFSLPPRNFTRREGERDFGFETVRSSQGARDSRFGDSRGVGEPHFRHDFGAQTAHRRRGQGLQRTHQNYGRYSSSLPPFHADARHFLFRRIPIPAGVQSQIRTRAR